MDKCIRGLASQCTRGPFTCTQPRLAASLSPVLELGSELPQPSSLSTEGVEQHGGSRVRECRSQGSWGGVSRPGCVRGRLRSSWDVADCTLSPVQVEHWLLQLSTELQERLLQDRQQNGRVAGQLAVGVRLQGGSQNSSFQRCGPLSGQDAPRIARDALQLIKVFNTAGAQGGAWSPAVLALCLSARNFSPSAAASTPGITHFLSSPHPQRLPQAQSSGAGGTGSPRGAARHRAGTIASFFLQTPPRPETHPDPDPCPSLPRPVTHPDPCPEPLPSPPRPVACPDTRPVTCPDPCPEPLPSPPWPATSPDPCPSPSPPRVNGDIDRVMPAAVDLPSLSFFKCKALDCSPVATPPSQPPPQPPACSLPPEVLVRCGRCGQSSLPWEVAEHEDFHFALDLQRSLSASPPPSSPSAPSVPRSPSNPSPPRVPSSPSAPRPPSPPRVPSSPSAPRAPSSPSAPRPPSPPRVPSSPSAPRAPFSPSAPRPKKKAAAQLGGAGKRVCSSGRTLEWYFRKAPP
ncbi:uncharacterized protein LOC127575535 [Pristis pectinata]|uniref:uncharacterized protein LOC127575535 n=1 Tax=Pristis pectinata TaxID=685728 RepID=UPI00223DCC3B|nr:uncharacterized protein LOC127575535 [Pristis pectinata]